MKPADPAVRKGKNRLRAVLTASRAARNDADRRSAWSANTDHLLRALHGRSCVAGYLPLPTEPLGPTLLDTLALTSRVLVPVTIGSAPLDWCEYPGPVRRGAFGILEPTGERLGAEAVAAADAVLVPALAVDLQGHRLGRGGGHYDRTLALRKLLADTREGPPAQDGAGQSEPELIAVLYDGEILHDIPVDELDQPVSAVVTPSNGIQHLGADLS